MYDRLYKRYGPESAASHPVLQLARVARGGLSHRWGACGNLRMRLLLAGAAFGLVLGLEPALASAAAARAEHVHGVHRGPGRHDGAEPRSALCGTWSSDPVACVRGYANVEWTELLPWNATGQLITYGQNAMPIGNGDYGALVTTDGIDTVVVALKAASAYDESGQIFTPGVINITYSPQPAVAKSPRAAPDGIKMVFDAGDASVTISIGSLTVLLWFDAVGDKLVVQHRSTDVAVVYTAAAEVFVGRPRAQTVPGAISP